MKQSPSTWYKGRLFLAVLLSGLGLIIWLFGGGRPAPSWAAPGQNPDMQTVPTRPSSTTPEPTPRPRPSEQPYGDNGGHSSVPLALEPDSPALTPAGSAVSSGTAVAPQPDIAAKLTATVVGSGEDTSMSPLPLPSPSMMPGAHSSEGADQSRPPPAPASAAVDMPDQPSRLVYYRASPPFWLYAIGLGLLLILGGLFLIKRW